MEKYLPNFKNCLQKEPPFCEDGCPFGYDILGFIEKIKIGNFNAAYKIYKNGVGFPAIASTLCQENCKTSCPLSNSINLKKLEQAVVEFANRKTPTDYNLPMRKHKIAIIGGGISGLACLLRLATKKYTVDIYEKSSKFGGNLNGFCDETIAQEDITLQLIHEEYNTFLNREIKSLDELDSYDAIYIATGTNGNTFGYTPALKSSQKELSKYIDDNSTFCFKSENTGIFFGGEILGISKTSALAMGLSMGVSIDNFLRTGNLNYGDGKKPSKIEIDPRLLHNDVEITPDMPYTKETAIEEANRCVKCQCNPCQVYCDLTTYEKKWPLRMRDEIQATTLPGKSEVKATPAKRLINTCTQCGLCEDTCPKDINLGGLILEGRKSMHRQEKMPWIFKEFWLKDMTFSNGDSSLVKSPASIEKPKYLYFPGCQLSAGEPTLVEKSYELLLKKEKSTGIFLGCCGLPAQWSGDESLTNEVLEYIHNVWQTMDKPEFILACPSCHKFFSEALPSIKTKYLYEFIDKTDVDLITNFDLPTNNSDEINPSICDNPSLNNIKENSNDKIYTIFDPCTTRKDSNIREVIRNILDLTSITIESNSYHEDITGCCGYGGQSHIADPKFIEHVQNRRLSESNLPYITYCINCRDSFKEKNSGTVHILDLLFNNTPTNPTVNQRRLNRLELKRKLLNKYWGETMDKQEHKYKDTVIFTEDIKTLLSEIRMLEEEILDVIEFCEKTKRVVYDEESKTFSGYRKIGKATYWVEYKKENDKIILTNAYTHRISIDLEEVWNGEKTIDEEML